MSKMLVLCAACMALGVARADASAKGEVNGDEYGPIPSLSHEPAKARVFLTRCQMKGMDLAAITEAFAAH